jgi:membrane associated rhomboid family serine protease
VSCGVDPITTMNFALCVVIVALAVAAYNKKKNEAALYIGAAFGFFGLSHFITLLGFGGAATTNALVIIRTIAYLIVIFALLKLWKP